MPVPVLPAASTTPVLSSVITLVVSVMLAVGVKVAVQVMPPSTSDTAVSVPLAIVRSALVNPLTASLKVKVTSEVSPACSALSATTMVAVGALRVDRVVVGVGGAGTRYCPPRRPHRYCPA